MKRFKITYQDRALNKYDEIWEAQSWEDAIIMAFSRKRADWKLIGIERLLTAEEEAAFVNVEPVGPTLCWFDDKSGLEPTRADLMEAAKKFGEETVTDLEKVRYGRDVLTRDDVIINARIPELDLKKENKNE
jgi:hypothetical protein